MALHACWSISDNIRSPHAARNRFTAASTSRRRSSRHSRSSIFRCRQVAASFDSGTSIFPVDAVDADVTIVGEVGTDAAPRDVSAGIGAKSGGGSVACSSSRQGRSRSLRKAPGSGHTSASGLGRSSPSVAARQALRYAAAPTRDIVRRLSSVGLIPADRR